MTLSGSGTNLRLPGAMPPAINFMPFRHVQTGDPAFGSGIKDRVVLPYPLLLTDVSIRLAVSIKLSCQSSNMSKVQSPLR